MANDRTRTRTAQTDHACCYHVAATHAVLADRERELIDLKGQCSTFGCRLHYAHSGPCDVKADEPVSTDTKTAQADAPDVIDAHPWQGFNRYGNTCHHLGCRLTEEEHAQFQPQISNGEYPTWA